MELRPKRLGRDTSWRSAKGSLLTLALVALSGTSILAPTPRVGPHAKAKSAEQAAPELSLQIGHSGWVRAVAFAPQGTTLARGGLDNTVKVWDAQNGMLVRNIPTTETMGVWAIAWSPDGLTLASGGPDGNIEVWDA